MRRGKNGFEITTDDAVAGDGNSHADPRQSRRVQRAAPTYSTRGSRALDLLADVVVRVVRLTGLPVAVSVHLRAVDAAVEQVPPDVAHDACLAAHPDTVLRACRELGRTHS